MLQEKHNIILFGAVVLAGEDRNFDWRAGKYLGTSVWWRFSVTKQRWRPSLKWCH